MKIRIIHLKDNTTTFLTGSMTTLGYFSAMVMGHI
jgi:hypothetical protein